MAQLRYDIYQGVSKAKTKLTLAITALGLVAGGGGASLALVGAASAAGCTSVTTSKGNLTTAQVGGDVTGDLDATGCDIGVYYDSSSGNVNNAAVHDANQYGVFVDGINTNVKVNVSESQVYNIGHHTGAAFTPNGSQTGLGVYYYGFGTAGSVSGKISNNNISQYQKGGIAVNGSAASANVSGNAVTGLDPVPFIAQNGIQFGYGATGQAKNNTVNGNSYTGPNWTSTGVLVFETSNVVVQGNTIENNQSGVAIETWCWFVSSASNNKVVNNTLADTQYGISVAAYTFGGYSTCDASANNNKVTNNTFESTGGDTGIFVGTGDYGGGFSPTVDNNKVVHNNVGGFTTDYDDSGDTATKVHANSFQ